MKERVDVMSCSLILRFESRCIIILNKGEFCSRELILYFSHKLSFMYEILIEFYINILKIISIVNSDKIII